MSEIGKLIEKEAAKLGNTICPELDCCLKIARRSKAAMRRVVRAERERCAQIAELTSKDEFQGVGLAARERFSTRQRESRNITAAIRKGTPE